MSNAWEKHFFRLFSVVGDVSWLTPTGVNPLLFFFKKKKIENCIQTQHLFIFYFTFPLSFSLPKRWLPLCQPRPPPRRPPPTTAPKTPAHHGTAPDPAATSTHFTSPIFPKIFPRSSLSTTPTERHHHRPFPSTTSTERHPRHTAGDSRSV
jgi:hypothetical protein